MAQQDACALLDSDHQKVERLFTEYQSAAGDKARQSDIAQNICNELTVHTTIEDEIFYPAFRKASGDNALVDDAEHEHVEARDLITQIEDADDMDPLIAQLEKAIKHHVQDEREKMFPEARKTAGLDLMALATQLEARKAELMAGFQTV